MGDVVSAAKFVPDEIGELSGLAEEERRGEGDARSDGLDLVHGRVSAAAGHIPQQLSGRLPGYGAMFGSKWMRCWAVVGFIVLHLSMVLLQLLLHLGDVLRRLLILFLKHLLDAPYLLLVRTVHQLQVFCDVLVPRSLLDLQLLCDFQYLLLKAVQARTATLDLKSESRTGTSINQIQIQVVL